VLNQFLLRIMIWVGRKFFPYVVIISEQEDVVEGIVFSRTEEYAERIDIAIEKGSL